MTKFEGLPEQISLVEIEAEKVYSGLVRRGYGEVNRVHQDALCVNVSRELTLLLALKGIPASVIGTPDPDWQESSYYYHKFVYLGNGWVADPTWQQFLKFDPFSVIWRWTKFRNQLPKVLVSSNSDLLRKLTIYGIPKEDGRNWESGLAMIVNGMMGEN